MRITRHLGCSVAIALCLLQASLALAQTKERTSLMLVTWFGPGGIELPAGQDWKPQTLNVYDGGRRPVAQYNKGADLTVSFILFENLSGNPSAQGCRDDVIAPIIQQNSKAISKRIDGEMKDMAGDALTTTSFQSRSRPGITNKTSSALQEMQRPARKFTFRASWKPLPNRMR